MLAVFITFARRLAALLPLSVLGCATFGSPTVCPARGGPVWREIRSAHFVLRTDADRSDALTTLGDFEATYAVLQDVGFPDIASAPPPVTVVLFDSNAALRELTPAGVDGVFYSRLPHDLEAEPTMVLPARISESGRASFTHELTHAFVRRAYGWAPIWLNEGLAQYYSTLRLEEGRVVLGKVVAGRLAPPSMIPSARAIVGADRDTFYAGSSWDDRSVEGVRQQHVYYAGAWLLVHMLMNGPDAYRARFRSFIHSVNDGERFEAAWERTFGGAAGAKLDDDFYEYLRGEEGSLMAAETSVRRGRAVASAERVMGDEEVHLLWARLVPWEGETRKRAEADLYEAAVRAPGSSSVVYFRALFALEQGHQIEAVGMLRDALARAPDDARLLLALAFAWERPTSRDQAELAAVMDRLARVATTIDQRIAAAAYLASVKRFDEGLAVVKRALDQDPTSWRGLATYARLLYGTGRFAEAVRAQERAAAFLPETIRDPALIEALDRYRRARDRSGR